MTLFLSINANKDQTLVGKSAVSDRHYLTCYDRYNYFNLINTLIRLGENDSVFGQHKKVEIKMFVLFLSLNTFTCDKQFQRRSEYCGTKYFLTL